MFKQLLVHLDPSDQGKRRLAAAAGVASTFDAHLTGLYVIPPEPVPPYAAGVPVSGSAALLEAGGSNELREQVDATRQAFESMCGRTGVRGRWRQAEGPVALIVSMHARYADLAIIGQDGTEPDSMLITPGLAAEVALDSGGPVLIIPHSGEWAQIGTRPMVAWSGTRESSRAVHDALPFLKRAKETTVLTVREPSGDSDEPTESELDIVAYLGRHGIEATFRRETTELDVADELLARMGDQLCDLLVMGAYGHSRLRELVFGGATKSMLAHMTAPVLMSN